MFKDFNYKEEDLLFEEVENHISTFARISQKNLDRPWGGFFVINEEDADAFIAQFFSHLTKPVYFILNPLYPVII